MKTLKKLREIGLAFLVASSFVACEQGNKSNIRIEPVKRYSEGKVLHLNRLEVDWSRNEKCKKLNPKYGFTAGDVLYDNVYNALKNSNRQRQRIFREGFELSESYLRMSKDYSIWRDKERFVIESSEPESTLVKLGREIYDCACNDPEDMKSY